MQQHQTNHWLERLLQVLKWVSQEMTCYSPIDHWICVCQKRTLQNYSYESEFLIVDGGTIMDLFSSMGSESVEDKDVKCG